MDTNVTTASASNEAAHPLAYFNGTMPAELRCEVCRQPLQQVSIEPRDDLRASNAPGSSQTPVVHNQADPAAVGRAIAGGAIAATLAGGARAAIMAITDFQFGLIASLIGVVVGKAVLKSSGNRHRRAYQITAAIFSTLGVLGGKFAFYVYYTQNHFRQLTTLRAIQVVCKVFIANPGVFLEPFDLLWIALAILAAWRICKAPQVSVTGPFSALPQTGLQFNQVQPTVPLPAIPLEASEEQSPLPSDASLPAASTPSPEGDLTQTSLRICPACGAPLAPGGSGLPELRVAGLSPAA